MVIVIPLRSNDAPEDIDTDALLAPRAAAFPTLIVPADKVVEPEYVFAFERVKVPVPILVKPICPVPFEIIPAYVVFVLLFPVVNVFKPTALVVTVAPSGLLHDPIVSLEST